MITSNKPALVLTVATLLTLAALALPGRASAFSAAGDFSSASNPNGAWSYGWTASVGSTFNLDSAGTANYQGTGLNGWQGNQRLTDGIPYILHNGTASPITIVTTTYQPGQLGLQAGDSAQDAVVRWTAPFSGTFSLAATFSGLSTAGDSADVHILHNGSAIYNSSVIGSPSPQSFSSAVSVLAGDTIDFVVGDGGNGQNEDTTALSATIVPEPGTLALVGMGFGGLLAFRSRKRTQKNGRPVISTTDRSASILSTRKATFIATAATLLCLAAFALPNTASASSAAGDFSTINNPNGAWSYGWSYGLGSTFTLDTTNTSAYSGLALGGWLGAQHLDGIPYVLKNFTAHTVANNISTVYQPGQLAEQPGESNQYSIVRWTAPFSGTFAIAANFVAMDSNGDSADVHILHNGVSFFDAFVGGTATYSGNQALNAGDIIDFAVGNSGNGPEDDSTGLSATIVPEPATLGLVGMGLGCLFSFRLRKRVRKNACPVTSTTEQGVVTSSARKASLIATAATLLCLAAFALPSTASASSAAGDFSNSSNPNGVWSYGFTTSLGSAFNAYAIPTNNYAGLGLNGWLGTSDSSGTPYALRNGTSHNVTNASTVYQPGQLGLQPGAQDQYSVIRWTAPFSGTFSINATFSGLDSVGDTSDVHILLDGISFFNASVGGVATYGGNQVLNAGDTIDFAVGFGSNGNNFSDTTALSATIVPEPGTLSLVALSLAGLLSFRFLKRK